MSTSLTIVFLLFAVAIGGWVCWQLFNTPNGERYLKMRTQGPFVPMEADDAGKAAHRDAAE